MTNRIAEPHRTADVCDAAAEAVSVCDPVFTDYGGRVAFRGEIVTVSAVEDNVKLRALTDAEGGGRVLVVDGGGSYRHALIGGNVARSAARNGWSGLVINGCIRDRHEIAEVDLGVKALGTCPRRPRKDGIGAVGVPVCFAGVTFRPGMYLYADADGVVVTEHPVEAPAAGD